MRCPACGREWAGDLSHCSKCGESAGYPLQPPEWLPLRGLANVLTVLLILVVAAIGVRLGLRLPGLEAAGWHGGSFVRRLDAVADFMMLGLGILFVVWFRRARINAERRGWRQRRARGWTFWGWIIPIANLWIPFQLMGDIWRAGLPPERHEKTAWLPVLWWIGWLLSGIGVTSSEPQPQLGSGTWTVSLCFLAISGMTLIAIIRAVSDGPVGSPHPGRPAAPPGVTIPRA
jgi:hypothetical protein